MVECFSFLQTNLHTRRQILFFFLFFISLKSFFFCLSVACLRRSFFSFFSFLFFLFFFRTTQPQKRERQKRRKVATLLTRPFWEGREFSCNAKQKHTRTYLVVLETGGEYLVCQLPVWRRDLANTPPHSNHFWRPHLTAQHSPWAVLLVVGYFFFFFINFFFLSARHTWRGNVLERMRCSQTSKHVANISAFLWPIFLCFL